ncbi:MAG: beta-N-acetylglucosaminidase domain-containing protein [Pseudomonadales bacterium]
MTNFQLGVIEGFYGRDWTDSDRLNLLPWLEKNQYDAYIYAPKSDHCLRNQWDQALTIETERRLASIGSACENLALNWGVGFSPLGAVHCFDASARKLMLEKLEALKVHELDILAVLFDDMHCATDELASRQCEIVQFITTKMPDQQLIVCPTYYSFDPILEKVFGSMPANYWQQLGAGLSHDIGVFWTGNKVCSESITVADLESISRHLSRPITLWDNYPVNDGEKASKYLHIDSFKQRDRQLSASIRGHFCNPMNQCLLSRLPLASLPELFRQQAAYNADDVFEQIAVSEYGDDLGKALIADRASFTQLGLAGLSGDTRDKLLNKYLALSHPAAAEVCEWLKGEYVFDPSCLTETGA